MKLVKPFEGFRVAHTHMLYIYIFMYITYTPIYIYIYIKKKRMFISTCSIKSYLRFGSGADPTAFGGKRLWRLPSKRSEVQKC